MQLLKRKRADVQGASLRLTEALCETGYISEQDKIELTYRIKTGDRKGYEDLKELLLDMAALIESM